MLATNSHIIHIQIRNAQPITLKYPTKIAVSSLFDWIPHHPAKPVAAVSLQPRTQMNLD